MLRNKNYWKNKKGQQGVTLLLAILILSSVMAISFSLASILFIELRSSSDLLKTESSLYAATGVGEQALFNLKRATCPDNDPSCYYSQFSNSVSLSSNPEKVVSNSPIFTAKVKANSSFSNTSSVYEFCPTTPVYVGSSIQGCGFGKLTVNYITTNASNDYMFAYLCEWDPNATYTTDIPCQTQGGTHANWQWVPPCTTSCGAQGTGYQNSDGSVMLTPNTSNTASWSIDPTKQQELIVTNPSGSGDIYFSVATFGSDSVTPQGLPYIGSTSINVATQSGQSGRKLRVTVPNTTTAGTNLGNSASFVTTDTTTKGSWHGVYGADGYNIIGATAVYPAYAAVNPISNLSFTYADPTADIRGPYKDSVTTNRIGHVWYHWNPWDLDVNLSDSLAHRIALYIVDWDSSIRSVKIEVLDGTTLAVLDTQNVSNYNGGKYLVWNISGHVIFRFTTTGGANSVLNAIFFR